MRPPHIAPAIAVTPHRLLGAIILLAVVVALAAMVARRRAGFDGRMVDEPLKRLNGFHMFGPDEDDEPPIHVPTLRARPAVPGSPAALRRAAATNGKGHPAPDPPPSIGVASVGAGTRAARLPAPAAPRAAAPRAATATATPRSRQAAPATAKPSAARPAAAARAASRDLTGSPAKRPRPERPPLDVIPGDGDILLVEDDVTIATMYQMLLSTKGYATRHAHDGVEGIAMVRDERPALILLDMMMPRMDGIQFLEALRGWPKTRSIPVVVLSNVGDRHLVERALALGAVEYLVKAQTRPQVLVGALPHWLRGNRALTTLS